ncbi:MAG: hypothetical protein HOM58_00880 [Rhodospirillaceae bacterium]|jgi:hypothetical protein|nr:hypothetical protein [Rhodospirillaceae bacterium]MBT5458784.1 hypothetical protein [Rhodospirillaceae bacterium]
MMKLDALKLGLATAMILAIIWLICSAFVVFIPAAMMQVSGHMLHADLTGQAWSMHWTGFLSGLIFWSVLGGLLVWAVAAVYNRLSA